MIVVDASVLLDAILGNRHLRAMLLSPDLHAPVTIDAEVLHGLRRAVLAGRVPPDDALYAIDLLERIDLTRHWIKPLVSRIWALRHNITAYDAGYVALAEFLGYPLITRDRRLARSAGHTARIEYID